jgi:D-3-phosphoglycerate dehydrogenase / 2-oxoglutarate reductase
MGKYKIVYTDNIYKGNDIEYDRFGKVDYDFIIASAHDTETLKIECKDADAVMVSFAEMNEDIIKEMEKCKLIVRCGMGVNNVDIPAATAKGIMVANVQRYCLDEVSDHALALVLTLLRKTASMSSLVRNGIWDPKIARPIPRLRGMTFGLYGFGAIATYAAEKAKAFGFQVVAYDPYLPAEYFDEKGVKRIENEEDLFKVSDILSVHLPFMKSTAGIISYDKLRMMKPTAIFINTARGGLVDEPGLIKALNEGLIGGAGLDVMFDEYPNMDNPLFQMENVVITPHIAYYSEGSDVDLRNYACDQVIKALEDGAPEFFLNKKELNQ